MAQFRRVRREPNSSDLRNLFAGSFQQTVVFGSMLSSWTAVQRLVTGLDPLSDDLLCEVPASQFAVQERAGACVVDVQPSSLRAVEKLRQAKPSMPSTDSWQTGPSDDIC